MKEKHFKKSSYNMILNETFFFKIINKHVNNKNNMNIKYVVLVALLFIWFSHTYFTLYRQTRIVSLFFFI